MVRSASPPYARRHVMVSTPPIIAHSFKPVFDETSRWEHDNLCWVHAEGVIRHHTLLRVLRRFWGGFRGGVLRRGLAIGLPVKKRVLRRVLRRVRVGGFQKVPGTPPQKYDPLPCALLWAKSESFGTYQAPLEIVLAVASGSDVGHSLPKHVVQWNGWIQPHIDSITYTLLALIITPTSFSFVAT